ncbi:hypothetical protein OG250_24640 [Streptomyces sp. NBC_00487]|uniref:hypothetical protein n=1 Tax=unclassified Streptomyces TaxID=2593676 RepID=UPI002E18E946|nr:MULTISPECIES: hypothetical protein [unclassified Streptomyces]
MRFVWLLWLRAHFGTYGYSHGLLRGSIGTLAVLVTAATIWAMVRERNPTVAKIAAGVVGVAGVGWLAAH